MKNRQKLVYSLRSELLKERVSVWLNHERNQVKKVLKLQMMKRGGGEISEKEQKEGMVEF